MKTLDKSEVLKDAKKYFDVETSSGMLQFYITKGVISRIDHYHIKGISGSVSIFPPNTPGMLYAIRVLQDQGMKLKEIRGYLSLFALGREAIRDIKDIIEEDMSYRENIIFKEGITPKIKEYLLKEVPLKLLRLKKLKITRLEKFKKIIELKAYSELDYKDITEIIIRNSKDLNSFNKIQDILDNPIIDINIENEEEAFISVLYEEPFNINVLFKENEIEIIR